MKFEENDPASFENAGAMADEECLGTVFEENNETVDSETLEVQQKQTFLTVPEEGEHISNLQSDRWRKLSRQIRGAIAIKNAAVKPNRRRSGRKSTANVDPFLQKFSTREIGLTTQASRASLHSIEEEDENLTPGKDGEENIEENPASGAYQIRASLTLIDLYLTGVIDPDGAFIYYWMHLLITAVRYNLWVIILRFAFVEAQENHPTFWWVFDSFADLIYLLDIFVNCRVGFFEEGILVRDSKLACKRYIMSWRFLMDVVSILPLELLYFKMGIKPILRFPRLLKTYKSQEIKAKVEGRANHPTIVRVFFLVHLMFLLLHWNAGIYFLISRAEGFGSNKWGYPALNGSYDTLTRKYVHSFYWSALTLTTIGDLPPPETNVGYFYTIACYLSGVFVFAMIVGNAGSIILDRNASRLGFEKQRDDAKNYMKIHNVPGDLQRRVVKWYDYSWSRGRMSGGSGDLNSLHLLPDKMKTEIALHVHLETLKKVTFLQNCEPEFLHELLLKMKLHIFTPGDLIIRHGEIAREMYLIAHGRIEVISETGKVLKELGSGEFFGEIGILSLSEGQNRRTADVRSIGYTECFVLSKDDVLGEIHQFPLAQKILAEYGRKRLKNTSDDPRLVKLDGQDSPAAKSRWRATRSHVINMLNEKQSPNNESDRSLKSISRDIVIPSLNSPGNITSDSPGKKTSSSSDDGHNTGEKLSHVIHTSHSRDQSSESRVYSNQPHDPTNKSRDHLKESHENSKENAYKASNTSTHDTDVCDETDSNLEKTGSNDTQKNISQIRGSTRLSRTRDSFARHPRDIGTCLNTLDYLKAVLQSTMHETDRQNEYVAQIERELSREKDRVNEAEQKIKSQEEEIRRLLKINQTLSEKVKQKDNTICEMEDVLQLTQTEYATENEVKPSQSKKEDGMNNVSVELSDDVLNTQGDENVFKTSTILDISDTQC